MKEETRIALEGSIQKWQDIVDGHGIDRGDSNCPLCILFGDSCESSDDICPVFNITNIDGCRGTPWMKWVDYVNIPKKVFDKRSRELAQAELDFLISLREDLIDE